MYINWVPVSKRLQQTTHGSLSKSRSGFHLIVFYSGIILFTRIRAIGLVRRLSRDILLNCSWSKYFNSLRLWQHFAPNVPTYLQTCCLPGPHSAADTMGRNRFAGKFFCAWERDWALPQNLPSKITISLNFYVSVLIVHVVNCTLYIQTEINDIKYVGKDTD